MLLTFHLTTNFVMKLFEVNPRPLIKVFNPKRPGMFFITFTSNKWKQDIFL